MHTVYLTYDELAERLGISAGSVRNLVRRKRWSRTTGNDGKARIAVPSDALPEAPPMAPPEAPSAGPQEAPQVGPQPSGFEADLAALRALVDAERARADAEAARADAEAARVDEVRQRLADLATDRDRWHALAIKPWWKRLAG